MQLEKLNIMVDLETLGSTPGCSILSIGAVKFDAEGLGSEYYRIIRHNSCPQLFEEDDTVAWWNRQAPEARKILDDVKGDKAIPLQDALIGFNKFVKLSGIRWTTVWGNGSDFDNAILACAYRAAKVQPEWKFWNNRCYRTLKNLHGDVPFNRQGTYHNALDDAKSQAEHAVLILKKMAA